MLEIDKFKKIIIANWKLNGSEAFVETYLNQINFKNYNNLNKSIIICPPLAYINQFKYYGNLLLGAQDCSLYTEGAYTGEISSKILKNIGCEFCIIGHSERRNLFGEKDNVILKKVSNCLKEEIVPILCIGENLQQKNNNETKEILNFQINNNIPEEANKSNMIIAYEPIWAIGTGKTPTLQEILEIHSFIKNEIPISKDFKILYGGSVKSSNSKQILSLKNVDGILVGSSSIKVNEFNKIIES